MAQRATEVRGDMNLVKLIEQYGDEARARACLERLRWPSGVRCPRCDSDKMSRVTKRNQYDCDSCRYQFSVTSGTVFHDTHLPLWKWLLATYLMVESKKGISANQLKRTLAVSYKTAWYLCHRIRSAMDDVSPELLVGIVEMDETYIGGKAKNMHKDVRARKITGTGGIDKMMVLGAMQRGGKVRLRFEQRTATGTVIRDFVDVAVADEAEAIYTDQLGAYKGIGDEDTRHEVVDHGAMEWVRGEVGTNGIESAWSLLKRSVIGSYHQLSAKHLQAYVDEFAFRFNNRENPFLFRDTLRKLLDADALPYRELVAHAAGRS